MDYYHIYNRGVERRVIFLNDRDYTRFLSGLLKAQESKEGERPVAVVGYCLMPNHYHLLLAARELAEVARFMRKLSTSYTMYFNKKRNREGVLFETNYKRQAVADDSYLLQVSRYIHLNPVSLIEPEWKDRGIRNADKAMEFLERYQWSSLPEYLGGGGCLTQRGLLLEMVGGKDGYRRFMREGLGEV